MLSDKFLKEDESFKNENLSEQISRLEELSISMTDLIENGNSHKIGHLEKLRQKILKDIIKQKHSVKDELQPRVSNLINLNKLMIERVTKEKSKSLSQIKKKINFYKSYRDI